MSPNEQYAMHQKAFRCAFDFLTAHFPPGQEPEWWDQTAKDVSAAAESQLDNDLTTRLLIGVYEYLSNEWKRRFGNGKAEG